MTHVEFKKVNKKFGQLEVIKDIDLKVEQGEFLALLGPSGCGKSTLLRLLAGLEDLSSGNVFIDGENVTEKSPSKRGIAMVFQSYALYPHMNVAENIAFSLDIAGVNKKERQSRTLEIAKMLELTALLERKPAELSGGQRQRVAIGRALIRNPSVFLFDEPLSNLDASLRVQMRLEIGRLHKKLKTTMIYVTHDQVEAMTLATRIAVLNAGTVAQVGAPLELYNQPNNKFVAAFIGSPAMNFIEINPKVLENGFIKSTTKEDNNLTIKTRHHQEIIPTDTLELGIRPEHITLCEPNSKKASATGLVTLVEHLGNSTMVYISSAAGPLSVATDNEMAVCVDDKVGLQFDLSRAHLFLQNGDVY